jgi:hypothetical protein
MTPADHQLLIDLQPYMGGCFGPECVFTFVQLGGRLAAAQEAAAHDLWEDVARCTAKGSRERVQAFKAIADGTPRPKIRQMLFEAWKVTREAERAQQHMRLARAT